MWWILSVVTHVPWDCFSRSILEDDLWLTCGRAWWDLWILKAYEISVKCLVAFPIAWDLRINLFHPDYIILKYIINSNKPFYLKLCVTFSGSWLVFCWVIHCYSSKYSNIFLRLYNNQGYDFMNSYQNKGVISGHCSFCPLRLELRRNLMISHASNHGKTSMWKKKSYLWSPLHGKNPEVFNVGEGNKNER